MATHKSLSFILKHPLTPHTASLSSTVDLVSVLRTLLVSFPSSKKVAVLGGFAFTDIYGRKGLVLIEGQKPLSKLLMTMGTMIVQQRSIVTLF